jgi:hypothetical protein
MPFRRFAAFGRDNGEINAPHRYQHPQPQIPGARRENLLRRYRIAVELNASIDYFYEELPPSTRTAHGIFDASESLTCQEALSRESMKLMQAYLGIRNPKTRRMIAELVVQAADTEPE